MEKKKIYEIQTCGAPLQGAWIKLMVTATSLIPINLFGCYEYIDIFQALRFDPPFTTINDLAVQGVSLEAVAGQEKSQKI